MERLAGMLGMERSLSEVNLALRYQVEHFRPTAVGAMHITCSDESESEAAKAFQEFFVEHLLPELKTWRRSPFRTANLGGRYEWGAIPLAEAHFALRESANEFKILLVKVNAHVAVRTSNDGMAFGPMDRYQTRSTACGALGALLSGEQHPFTHDMESAMCSEGLDRIAPLRDSSLIDPNVRMLFAAILSAKAQARKAVLDIQEHTPATPTLYIVLACVTLNRSCDDTELACGYYLADYRQAEASILYHGLGDDPTHYHLDKRLGRLCVEDNHLDAPRPARDHRQMVIEAWQQREDQFADPAIALFSGHADGTLPPEDHNQRVAQLVANIQSGKHLEDEYAKPILRMLLAVLADVSPIPAALLLFGEGVAAIYHVHRMHELARELDRDEDARTVVAEVSRKIDELPPQSASEVTELLMQHYLRS